MVLSYISSVILIFNEPNDCIFFILSMHVLLLADIAWLRLILVCSAIVGMSVSFTTAYLFSGELFPTVIRNIGVGTSSMCARIGSISAPFIVSLVSSRIRM